MGRKNGLGFQGSRCRGPGLEVDSFGDLVF